MGAAACDEAGPAGGLEILTSASSQNRAGGGTTAGPNPSRHRPLRNGPRYDDGVGSVTLNIAFLAKSGECAAIPMIEDCARLRARLVCRHNGNDRGR